MAKYTRITLEPFLTFSSLLRKRQNSRILRLLDNLGIKYYLFYSYGRLALLEGLKMLGCDKGSNILLPAYICKVALFPFHEIGIEPRFYEVSNDLKPDLAQITNIIDKKTRGIMVVDYFGFPARNFEEIQNICEKSSLFLIEDNAHSFLSRKGSRLLGTLGDIGISSLWKVLPVPNGAVLLLNKDNIVENSGAMAELLVRQNQYPPTSRKYVRRYIITSLLNHLETRYKFPVDLFRNIYHKSFPRTRGREGLGFNAKVAISNFSLQIAQGLNLHKIYRIRRQNYDFWLSELSQRKGLNIIFNDLADGVCPLVFPVLVEDVEAFSREMMDKRIQSLNWPTLPTEVLDNPEYPAANYLARHVFILPVHQSLRRNNLRKSIRQ